MLSVFGFFCISIISVVFYFDEYVICIKWEVVYNNYYDDDVYVYTDIKNEMFYIILL